ncbi:M1 family metallopeptidase [Massilia sp. YIM B02769]|uniref:M1 family metallopeptidase n=1 Tax=Massilia sp. YIM B02769 TaxID=3050129 RepID=UPI0025B62E60|nr:M1 family metallopeptidase [Massilia sp. YIM B02769]MDN4061049.1 M1 family metallopeptidase [Massilia sp. YIM B02769]
MTTSTLLRATLCAILGTASAQALALDPLSYANYDQVRTRALHMDLKADFEKKTLSGFAELSLDWLDKSARTLDLDTRELTISKIEAQDAMGRWTPAKYSLDKFDQEKGQALHVQLPAQAPKVRIHYHTAPTASALQWLTPAQTLSGKRPFMFSQSQSINARSWVPVQDTPSVRFTYTARIQAPQGLRVVMSADNNPKATGKGGWKFTMPQPIPSYLLAIGIGELEARTLGSRTGVYAEPLRMQAAAYELADTEKMVEAAESLYGPYRWGRYDMLVLPPSFPIGGMENPRLTFLTPTMIAGDRSLVDLIAHELAHSWSGNLVTNASWKHWWLNEGFTTYVTTRILEVLYGEEVALMNLQLEQEEAIDSLKEIPPAKQALVTRAADTGSDTYTDEGLAYPKGAWFLRTLEERAGRAVFDPFLRGWFDSHAFQSVTTGQFIAYLRSNLLAKHPEVMSDAELDEWLYGPGIPASAKHARSQRLTALDAATAAWIKGELPTAKLDTKGWTAAEWMKFLNDIDNKVDAKRLKELDLAFGLARTGNNEVAFRFYRAAVHAGYRDIRPQLNAFLMSVGRQKFVVPLYTALRANAEDRAWAENVYKSARERYHPETQGSVDKQMAKQ